MGFMPDVPRSERFEDVYFSADDGPGETAHVFLDGNNLAARWQGADMAENGRFVIGETGFGTGLNFLLAWELFDRTAPRGAMLDFISVEKYPMTTDAIRQGLAPWADRLSPYLDKMLARYPMIVPGFHRMVFDNRIVLTLIFDDANDALAEVEGQVDAWFLDGFTPSKNPDMWTDKVFGDMARLSHDQTTFATFTAAGFVKRGLQNAGFHVEKQKGFGRKRDMLAGRFTQNRKRAVSPPKHIAIIGAGLAGCALASVLPQYGLEPVLYDPNGIAGGASGNPVGIINPRLSAFRTPESDFYTAAFAMAGRELPLIHGTGYERCGSLHLVTDDEKDKKFKRAIENWGWDPAHMRMLDAVQSSDIAGITLAHNALYLPDAGKVSPRKLCEFYAKDAILVPQLPEGEITIFAHGAAMTSDSAFAAIPVHTVRGQITQVIATAESARLKTNLCYGGYMSSASEGVHVVGSTFQKWLSDTAPLAEDDQYNLQQLSSVVPSMAGFEIAGHRAALRVSSKDRFPVIGPNADRPDQFLSTALGSHGIIGSLLGAHILADYLRGGPFSVGKSTLNALSPARFKARENGRTAKKA